MPRGYKLPWVTYEEQVINLTSNEIKQFDWTTSVAHKCGPKDSLALRPIPSET